MTTYSFSLNRLLVIIIIIGSFHWVQVFKQFFLLPQKAFILTDEVLVDVPPTTYGQYCFFLFVSVALRVTFPLVYFVSEGVSFLKFRPTKGVELRSSYILLFFLSIDLLVVWCEVTKEIQSSFLNVTFLLS